MIERKVCCDLRAVIGASRLWYGVSLVAAILVGVAAAAQLTSPAHAERRVALVIGNSAYQHTAQLVNPVNDAALMAATLKAQGFDVTAHSDLDLKGLKRALSGFFAKVQGAGGDAVVLVYYAGHGVQVGGFNYLIPVDAQIDQEGDVDVEAVRADSLIAQIALSSSKSNTNIIILDACRNNPFRGFSRGDSRGLAQLEAARGTLVAFSTAPGSVARDGPKGGNSPYSAALAKAMVEKGVKIEDVFKRVRQKVNADTSGFQTPWESSSLVGDFYPAGRVEAPAPVTPVPTAPQPVAAPQPPMSLAAEAWAAAKDTTNPAELEAIIKRYGDTVFGDFAKERLVQLKKSPPASQARSEKPVPIPPTPAPPTVAALQAPPQPPKTASLQPPSPPPSNPQGCTLEARQTDVDEAGRVYITLQSSCPMETIKIRYRDWTFTRRLPSSPTQHKLIFDLFQGPAQLTIDANSATATLTPSVPASQSLVKIALVWDAPVELNLHVLQFAARPGEADDVWSGNRRGLTETRSGRSGLLSYAEPGEHLQVYTYIKSGSQARQTLQVRVDYASRGARAVEPYCETGPLASVDYMIVQYESGKSEEHPRSRSINRKACGANLSDEDRYEQPVSTIKF